MGRGSRGAMAVLPSRSVQAEKGLYTRAFNALCAVKDGEMFSRSGRDWTTRFVLTYQKTVDPELEVPFAIVDLDTAARRLAATPWQPMRPLALYDLDALGEDAASLEGAVVPFSIGITVRKAQGPLLPDRSVYARRRRLAARGWSSLFGTSRFIARFDGGEAQVSANDLLDLAQQVHALAVEGAFSLDGCWDLDTSGPQRLVVTVRSAVSAAEGERRARIVR